MVIGRKNVFIKKLNRRNNELIIVYYNTMKKKIGKPLDNYSSLLPYSFYTIINKQYIF